MVTKLASMSTPHSPIVWSVTSSGGEEISDRDTSGRVEDELGERLANWELQRSTTGRRLAYSSRSGPAPDRRRRRFAAQPHAERIQIVTSQR
jgi:hypothetical protein